jgi:hypothetical protein
MKDAEVKEGPNLYAYVGSNPVNGVDPLGLCCEKEYKRIWEHITTRNECQSDYKKKKQQWCQDIQSRDHYIPPTECIPWIIDRDAEAFCFVGRAESDAAFRVREWFDCITKPCDDPCPKPGPNPEPKPRCGTGRLFLEFITGPAAKIGLYAAGGGLGGGGCTR